MKKVLLVCGEIYPLIKTGGLADFAFSYSRALSQYANTIVLVPGYHDLLSKLSFTELLYQYTAAQYPTQIISSRVPDSGVTLWIVHSPALFDRPGSPYLDASGSEYSDSPQRFCHFCKVAVDIAMGKLGLSWQPDIVHCNDWHTGLIPAYLSEQPSAPATVFTIHNLAYQGNYPAQVFDQLRIPWLWRDYHYLEYHGQLSFIKGGLVFADRITTVSPSYAEAIQTAQFGCGLEGLLRHRSDRLSGILNGVDYDIWNPRTDAHLRFRFDENTLENKAKNKLSLQRDRGLGVGKSWFTIGFIGRLVHQKGIELLLHAITANLDKKIQWLVVGKGEAQYEYQLRELNERYPDRVLVEIGYDEIFAHQVEASADAFLMPSHYEPCGLNQLYSLKYGTVPIVSLTGGLKDSIVDTSDETLAQSIATGFQFAVGDIAGMQRCIEQAAALFRRKKAWRKVQWHGMTADFSWQQSVAQYRVVYQQALADRGRTDPFLPVLADNSTASSLAAMADAQ